MQNDPAAEWTRLTRLYAEKSDEELLALAEDFDDLTEIAQGILRDEMRRRNLALPERPARGSRSTDPPKQSSVFGRWSSSDTERCKSSHGRADDTGNNGTAAEYTWKTELCECDDWDLAWQLSDALRGEGIESWTEGPRTFDETGLLHPRVLVPADRLEEARAIAARPIAQEVIDLHRKYVPSRCPRCGAGDPILEAAVPANQWRCEECGAEWVDSATLDRAAPSPDL
jgi:hypothetical protein